MSGAFSRVVAAGTLTVRVTVTNSGERAGQEVAQLYVRDAEASVERPEKELEGFVKVALEPGETKIAELSLNMRALAYFDEQQNAWIAEAGVFEVLVGASSADTRGRATFRLSERDVDGIRSAALGLPRQRAGVDYTDVPAAPGSFEVVDDVPACPEPRPRRYSFWRKTNAL